MDQEAMMRLVPYVVLVILTAIPSVALFGRLGMSRVWAFLSFVPLGMLIILWIVAYGRWKIPGHEATPERIDGRSN